MLHLFDRENTPSSFFMQTTKALFAEALPEYLHI